MAEGPCGGDAALKTEIAALEMYRFAALMLGDEAEAQRLVETSVESVDIDPCADPCAARGEVRERVIDGALAIMLRQDPASFAALPAAEARSGCLEDDSAPLPVEDYSHWLAGDGRGRLREWLSRLTQAQRAVFLQRAVLGRTNADTAHAINRIASPATWTAEAVGSLFRQALCSLASAMARTSAEVHA